MKTQAYYDIATRNAIIKDLLKKTPKAKLGDDATGMEITVEDRWCDRYSKYRMLDTCNKVYWGYTQEQIMMLGDIGSESGVNRVVCELLRAEGKYTPNAATRRTNRLMDHAFSHVLAQKRRGLLPGVYKIRRRWDDLGAVVATNHEHATQLGVTLFAAICPADEVRVSREGDTSEALLMQVTNDACNMSRFDAQEARARKTYDDAIASIAAARTAAGFAQIVALGQLEQIEEAN